MLGDDLEHAQKINANNAAAGMERAEREREWEDSPEQLAAEEERWSQRCNQYRGKQVP